jgi:hypothetical protein
LKNEGGNENHWLGLTMIGTRSPGSALGAKVTVNYGGDRQVLINQPANAYLSYFDPRLHVGLGQNAKIDRLEIIWPDGSKDIINNIKADQYLTIVQGIGIKK